MAGLCAGAGVRGPLEWGRVVGWSSGSYLAEETWDLVREFVPEKKRKQVAKKIYGLFSDHDADGWDLVGGLVEDAGLAETCKACGAKHWREDECYVCE